MTDLDQATPLDDFFLDQIVDGVLTPAQLGDAVLRLDREPGGWKRCALAFLEAQAWSESFRAVGESRDAPAGDHALRIDLAAVPNKPAHPRWVRSAVAAGIVAAAFSVGWFGHGVSSHPGPDRVIVQSPPVAVPDSAVSHPTQESPEPDGRTSVDTQGMAALPSDMGGIAAFPPNAVRVAADPKQVVRTVAHLRVGPEYAPAEVPILAGPGVTEEWLRQQPPPVSEHGQVVFQRLGYQVEQHRRFLTTVLPDGRRLAIPVDEVQIQYTGNEPL
jgi:hypothetical protein